MTAIMAILQQCQGALSLLAFEFLSDLALEKVINAHGLQPPLRARAPFYALVEFEDPAQGDDAPILTLVENCMASGWVADAVLSHSEAQRRSLWRLREDISETIAKWTPYKNDIATTVANVPILLERVEALIADRYNDLEVVWYGHIGDGNLHLNILKPESSSVEDFQQRCAAVSRELFQILADLGGSVSAEHGVGLLKKEFLTFSRSDTEIGLMREIKKLLDPDGILNPGKLIEL